MAPASRRWFWPCIIALVCLFFLVIYQRNTIRAHWWAAQLAEAKNLTDQAYYLASLAAVGDSAAGAVRRLARDEDASARALAVIATARLPGRRAVDGLRRLMADADREVAESAAVHLAFMADRSEALDALITGTASEHPRTAVAATAALSRVGAPRVTGALRQAAIEHPEPLVRAQAVESMIALMTADLTDTDTDATSCGPVRESIAVLVAAVNDQATFAGRLALERQVDEATAFIRRSSQTGSPGSPEKPSDQAERTVAQIAADGLARLTGRTIEHQIPRTPTQQAEFVNDCCRWTEERRSADLDG